ncbi:hypothetical protein SAMN04488554_2131 [Ruania alba]|uniref:Uncharacterized protein n=1 Tax=Ruania alba TaxID=648782 RepID=A0A1H5K9Y3_9MICO|nr:hypothetical protein SAMN04488554_0008 [Ruania alba]SEE60821.1 hypothetical protein SAMN04488554_2131 [Ruania alba]
MPDRDQPPTPNRSVTRSCAVLDGQAAPDGEATAVAHRAPANRVAPAATAVQSGADPLQSPDFRSIAHSYHQLWQ